MRHGQAQAWRGQQQQVQRGVGSSSRCGASWAAAAGAVRHGQQQQEWCGVVWAAGVVQHGHAFEILFYLCPRVLHTVCLNI